MIYSWLTVSKFGMFLNYASSFALLYFNICSQVLLLSSFFDEVNNTEPEKLSGLRFDLDNVSWFTQPPFVPPPIWRCWNTTSYSSYTLSCGSSWIHTRRLQGRREVETIFLPSCLFPLASMVVETWVISAEELQCPSASVLGIKKLFWR